LRKNFKILRSIRDFQVIVLQRRLVNPPLAMINNYGKALGQKGRKDDANEKKSTFFIASEARPDS